MELHLVRHGRPVIEPGKPASSWPLEREAARSDWFPDQDEFRAAVFRAFNGPDRAARPGWEPFDRTRERVRLAVAEIVQRSTADVVLVGHGTAWTLLVAAITGRPPDTDSRRRLRMPDLCTLDLTSASVARAWGTWRRAAG